MGAKSISFPLEETNMSPSGVIRCFWHHEFLKFAAWYMILQTPHTSFKPTCWSKCSSQNHKNKVRWGLRNHPAHSVPLQERKLRCIKDKWFPIIIPEINGGEPNLDSSGIDCLPPAAFSQISPLKQNLRLEKQLPNGVGLPRYPEN